MIRRRSAGVSIAAGGTVWTRTGTTVAVGAAVVPLKQGAARVALVQRRGTKSATTARQKRAAC